MESNNRNRASEPGKFWFSLDNAAKIFPAIITKEITSVLRLTAVLKRPVKIKPLQKAILLAEKRFPYFRVQLKEGFFWYYLEHLPRHFPVIPDNNPPCRKFPKGSILIRFLVRDNNVSAEFSHILTDGTGALEFFKTILTLYSHECSVNLQRAEEDLTSTNQISEEEYEDAYNRFFKAEIPPMIKRSKAFHLPFPLKPYPRFTVLKATMPMKQIKEAAHREGVSITVYLTAIYLYILQEIYEKLNTYNKFKKQKTIRVQVPVNLRNVFKTKTMRNFSLFVMPEIDLRLGHYTFEEIVKVVFHQVKLESDEKLIHKNISRNVSGERNPYVRGIPLFLKSLILRLKYYSLGTSQYSGVLTNLGKIDLPGDTAKMIDYFIMTPPPPNKMLKLNCGVAGFGDKLVLSFGNITQSVEFEDKFLQFLKEKNIDVEREN